MTKSRVYTRTGDKGTTSLVGGTRVDKDSPRLEAYGTVDELNSWIGLLAASEAISDEDRQTLTAIQNRLFDIGAALATEPESKWQPTPLDPAETAMLEAEIDRLDGELPQIRSFVLPGGHPDAARANIARTVARRAERRILAMARQTTVNPQILNYINRLSDYLFVFGRHINHTQGVTDTPWTGPKA